MKLYILSYYISANSIILLVKFLSFSDKERFQESSSNITRIQKVGLKNKVRGRRESVSHFEKKIQDENFRKMQSKQFVFSTFDFDG